MGMETAPSSRTSVIYVLGYSTYLPAVTSVGVWGYKITAYWVVYLTFWVAEARRWAAALMSESEPVRAMRT